MSSELPPSESAFPPPTSSEPMCAVHPDRPSRGTCDHCGAFSCEDCLGVLGGRYICRTCVEEGRVQTGLTPWDRRDELGLAAAFWQTVTAVSSRPVQFFKELRAEGDLGSALLFLALVSIPAGIGNTIFSAVTNAGLQTFLGAQSQQTGIPWVDFMQEPSLALSAFQVLTAPIWAIIGALIGGLLAHLGLMLVGGATRSLEATLKVYAYGYAVMFWAVIPGAQLVTAIWVLVMYGIGIAQTHRTSGWKAAFAVLWLTVLCCAFVAVAVGIGVFVAASSF